jgi:hypothetical protein
MCHFPAIFFFQAAFLLRPILHLPCSGTRVLRFSTAADTWGCAGSWGFSASELRRAGTVDWGVVIGLGDSVGACWESKNSHGTGCRTRMVRARISNSDSNHVCDGRDEPEPGPEALGWDGGVASAGGRVSGWASRFWFAPGATRRVPDSGSFTRA